MSGGDINILLHLWTASVAPYNARPPFYNHKHLYNVIDSTKLENVPWESFLLTYTGARPEDGEAPSWIDSEYEIWFRDPRALIHNLIANPDFKDEFDYIPFREYDGDENRRYKDFMSANWAWKQAVCFCSLFHAFH